MSVLLTKVIAVEPRQLAIGDIAFLQSRHGRDTIHGKRGQLVTIKATRGDYRDRAGHWLVKDRSLRFVQFVGPTFVVRRAITSALPAAA